MFFACLPWLPVVSEGIHNLSSGHQFLLPEASFFSSPTCTDDHKFFRSSLGLWCQPETSESSSIKNRTTLWELIIELLSLYQVSQSYLFPFIIHIRPVSSIFLEKFEYYNYECLPFCYVLLALLYTFLNQQQHGIRH